jgi:hypothetical protein
MISWARALTRRYPSVIVPPSRISPQFVMNPAIEALLRPRSIAIPGASADFQKVNGRTLKALLDKGYAGEIYRVNPKCPASQRCAVTRT